MAPNLGERDEGLAAAAATDNQKNPSSASEASRERLKEVYKPMLQFPQRRMSIFRWLEGKIRDDAIGEKYWRIDDKLYDLTDFINKHPGGPQWLSLTKGTDITEAFHVSHVFGDKAEKVLAKYFVRNCSDIPRKSDFTFKKNDFYMKLKARAAEILKDVGTGPTWQINALSDALLVTFWALVALSIYTQSFVVSLMAGITLGMLTSCAHNYIHQKDTFRRFYLDVAAFSSTDWRILHFLSHHLHTNTYNDFENLSVYPIVDWNVTESKNFIHKYLAMGYYQIFFFMIGPLTLLNKIGHILIQESKTRPEDVIPYLHFLLVYLFSGLDGWSSFFLAMVAHCACGYWVAFTTLIATHHHPSLYHAGDFLHPETDWGLRQLDATRDVEKSPNLFWVATTFGDHLLHHLFPTVDHSKLHLLYPALYQTCQEFNVKYEFEDWWEMLKGMHLQLHRDQPLTYEQREALRGTMKKNK